MRRGLAVVLCAWLLACEQPAPPELSVDSADPAGEMMTAIAAEPDTIDPQRASFANEIAQSLMVYEPLLTFDPLTLRPVPAAARALPAVSDDGLTVSFALRDGLVYSDGTPVRAGDFAFGWSRLCDPNVGGEYAFAAYVVSGCERWSTMDPKRASAADLAAARAALGVHAPDDAHLVFTLARPAPWFLAVAGLWVGAPVRGSDVATGTTWTEPATYVGNGPFRLVEWAHGRRLVFERNDRYRAAVRLKRWTKTVITDPVAIRAAFDRGELTVASAGRNDVDAVRGPASCVFFLGFNTARPPFDDPDVRLAFARAIDRDAYVSDVLDLPGRAARSLIPAGLPASDPNDPTQRFDPASARALLAGSRYGAAMPPIRFTYVAQTKRISGLVRWTIAQWAANLGVAVADDPLAPGATGPLVKKAEQVPALFSLGWCGDYPDPQDWLSTIFRSGATATHTGYRSVEFDALVARADVERDAARRIELYRDAQRVLTKEAPVAFLYASEPRYLVSPRLRGYTLSAVDREFGQLTLGAMYLARPGF